MKSYTNDIIRRAELLARVMNGEELSKADAAVIYKVKEITVNRDLQALRNNGIRIYSKKNKLIIEEIPTTSELISIASDYLPLKLNSDIFHKQVKIYSKTDKKNFFAKLVLLSKAVDESKIINLNYRRFCDNKSGVYILYPVRLVNSGFNWILHAYKEGEEELKIFYLARIDKIKLSDKKYNKLALPTGDKKKHEVELKFDAKVRFEVLDKIWFENYEVEEEDEYIIIKTKQAITNALASWCISWWDQMEVIKPLELKTTIKAMYKDFAKKNKL